MIRLIAHCALVAFLTSFMQDIPAPRISPAPLRVIASAVPPGEILRFAQNLAPDLPLTAAITTNVRPKVLFLLTQVSYRLEEIGIGFAAC